MNWLTVASECSVRSVYQFDNDLLRACARGKPIKISTTLLMVTYIRFHSRFFAVIAVINSFVCCALRSGGDILIRPKLGGLVWHTKLDD